MDFGKYIVFSNGVTNLIRDPSTGNFSLDYGTAIPLAGAICNAGHRAYLGNIGAGVDTNKVLYSEIGKMKFSSSTNLDTARANTSGFIYMEWDGTVYSLVPMGNKVVVYGSDGITVLAPTPVEPTAYGAVGRHEIDRVGIPSASCVVSAINSKDGTTDRHYFISNDGYLYMLSKDFTVKFLGYKEFITAPSSTRLAYNSRDNELIIGAPTTSYILTALGLGAISTYIEDASYSTSDGLLVHSSSAISQTEYLITTDEISFSWPGFKMIEDVIINGDLPDDTYISVTYRVTKTGAWTTSTYRKVTSVGYGFVGIEAIDFKINIKVPSYTTPIVRGISIGVKHSDKRFTKGVGVSNDNQTTTRTDS
jgi:hypothetical protein